MNYVFFVENLTIQRDLGFGWYSLSSGVFLAILGAF